MRRTLLFLLLAATGPRPVVMAQADSVVVESDSTYGARVSASRTLSYDEWRAVSDDTMLVRPAVLDTAALGAYRRDPELDYDRTFDRTELLSERLWRMIQELLRRLFGNAAGEWVFRHLQWIVLGIALLLLGFFFRRRLFGAFLGNDPTRTRQVREIEEDIERLDLDALLGKAERANDWRMAVRYQYLKVLRRLVDEGRITWEPRYTDQDYLAQLKDPASRATFSELSFLFKWVWYGDAPVDEHRYQRVRPTFEAFHQRPAAR